MSVDYEQLRSFVKEAMFTRGGINEPSAPEDVPHRMPAADSTGDEVGDNKATELYYKTLVAREATEHLVEALDEPIYDETYEHAFRASAALRRALNSLENAGAIVPPEARVVAPPKHMQKYNASGFGSMHPGGSPLGNMSGGQIGVGLQEVGGDGDDAPVGDELKGFGSGVQSQSAQSTATKQRAGDIASGDILRGVDNRERKILSQMEKIFTDVADKVDLVDYRPMLMQAIRVILKKVEQDPNLNK